MTGAPPSVTTESILTEFPALTPDTAEDFADRIRQPAAAENAINLLRSCPPEHAEAGAGIITTRMDSHDAEILHQLEPDERPDFGDSLWIDSDGFSPFRTTVIKLACAALDRTEPHLLQKELEDLDPWICQLDNMRLNPDLQDWENCRDYQALWQRHVLDRDYDENTARLLGHSKGRLPVWDIYDDVHKVDNLIIIPIRSVNAGIEMSHLCWIGIEPPGRFFRGFAPP